MEAWIVGIIMGGIELVITTVLGLWIKTWWNRKQKDKEDLEQLKEEKRNANEAKRCEVVKAAVHDEVSALEEKVKEEFKKTREENKKDIQSVKDEMQVVKEDLGLVKSGLQKDLYIDLVHLYDEYIQKGHISRSDKRDYDSLYWTYHNLGKNGVADHMHEKIMNLPELPEGE